MGSCPDTDIDPNFDSSPRFCIFSPSFEVDILSNLLKAQCDMADWRFLPSLLHLHESYVKLSSWCQFLPPGEVSVRHVTSLTFLLPRSDCKFSPLAATHFLVN